MIEALKKIDETINNDIEGSLLNEFGLLKDMLDTDFDFKILFSKESKSFYIILLHYEIKIMNKIIKNFNNIYGVLINPNNNEEIFLKISLDEKEMIFFNDCENIILTDSKNFINNNIQINTISFNKESDNFSLTITEELKEIFN